MTDDTAGQRVVSATAKLPASLFAAQNVRAIPDVLAADQASLLSQGANIGRTITVVSDPTTGDPLYVSGDDRLWGYASDWISPLVVALPGFQLPEFPSPNAPSAAPPGVPSPTVPPAVPPVVGLSPALSPWAPPASAPSLPPLPR